MISVSGTDGSAMGALALRLRDAVASAPAEEPRAIRPVVEQLIDQSFIFATAPNGHRWASRKAPTGTWPLLVNGGHMFAGRRVLTGISELLMTLPTPAEFHQGGTRYMVKRQILPSAKLPAFWQARIGAARAMWWRTKIGGAS